MPADNRRILRLAMPLRGDEFRQIRAGVTPRRWEVLCRLIDVGPLTIAELSRSLRRHYADVHRDVGALARLRLLERGEDGQVSVPWDELVLQLPSRRAAGRKTKGAPKQR